MRALGGLLYLAAALALAFLWARGYLSGAIATLTGLLAAPPALRPIVTPAAGGGGSGAAKVQ